MMLSFWTNGTICLKSQFILLMLWTKKKFNYGIDLATFDFNVTINSMIHRLNAFNNYKNKLHSKSRSFKSAPNDSVAHDPVEIFILKWSDLILKWSNS